MQRSAEYRPEKALFVGPGARAAAGRGRGRRRRRRRDGRLPITAGRTGENIGHRALSGRAQADAILLLDAATDGMKSVGRFAQCLRAPLYGHWAAGDSAGGELKTAAG